MPTGGPGSRHLRRNEIEDGIAVRQQAIRDEESNMGQMVNGWQPARDLGRYGTKYTNRARGCSSR